MPLVPTLLLLGWTYGSCRGLSCVEATQTLHHWDIGDMRAVSVLVQLSQLILKKRNKEQVVLIDDAHVVHSKLGVFRQWGHPLQAYSWAAISNCWQGLLLVSMTSAY